MYAAMGLASWMVWRRGGFAAQSMPLTLYGVLLIATYLAWPPAFVTGNQLYAAVDCIGKSLPPQQLPRNNREAFLRGICCCQDAPRPRSIPGESMLLPFISSVMFAVMLGLTGTVTSQFHARDPIAGFLLLPFLGYATFSALLLGFSFQHSSIEVQRDSCCSLCHAQRKLSMPCCLSWTGMHWLQF